MTIDALKAVFELLRSRFTVEEREKIADLRDYVLELREENAELREELRKCRQTIARRDELVFKDAVYWRKDGEELEGPYCQICYETSQYEKQIHLEHNTDRWFCRSCRTTYYKPGCQPRALNRELERS